MLDGGPESGQGWSYLTADPPQVITWDECAGDGLAALGNVIGLSDHEPDWPAPFPGGAIGYLAYDSVFPLESLRVANPAPPPAGYLWAGVYDWLVAREEFTGRCWVRATNALGRDPHVLISAARTRLTNPASPTPIVRVTGLTANMDRDAYSSRVRQVLDYIARGDCYQVNLARRLTMQCDASSLDVYRQLIERHSAPFGALLQAGPIDVVSASPELFLRSDGRHAIARPIKGTRPRGNSATDDLRQSQDLRASSKDRAENVMIVDVTRNDFGRVCTPGTVKVTSLWSAEPHPTVWQLVSGIGGELPANASVLDLLRACAPSGSVTGAPKLRAIEIIEELEPARRGAYCGSVFALGFDGSLTANVAIRTLQLADGCASLHVGAGIVAGSDPDREYDETAHKAMGILRALGAHE